MLLHPNSETKAHQESIITKYFPNPVSLKVYIRFAWNISLRVATGTLPKFTHHLCGPPGYTTTQILYHIILDCSFILWRCRVFDMKL
jgi:hypothetical protein